MFADAWVKRMHRAFTKAILGFLDRMAPPLESPSAELRRRSRGVMTVTLIGFAILTATAVSTLLLGFDTRLVPLNFGWCLALVALLLVARRIRSLPLLANGLVALGFCHTLLLAAGSGGRNTGALFAFAVFPMLAVLLAGWRSGLVFTGMSGAAVLLAPLSPFDFLAPSHTSEATAQAALVRDALNVIFAVGFVAALYDAARNVTLVEAEASRARAESVAHRQEQLVALSRRLHLAVGGRFEEVLGEAMEQTARLAGANRTMLQLFGRAGFAERFEWSDEASAPYGPPGEVSEAGESFAWTAAAITSGQITMVSSLDDLPPEASGERAHLESRGVASWLCVPICASGRTIAYQAFETFEEKIWEDELVASLQLMSELLASTILRHRSEEALRESEEKFSLAFLDHPDAMLIIDLETEEIVECNEQWLCEAGVEDRDRVLGRRPWDFDFAVPEPHRHLMLTMLREEGQLPAVEVSIVARGGETRTYLISAARIDLGGRVCAVANIHDLTQRKVLEQQLLHAQKMEAVGRLAGGIAHDYNNMLTVITGYSAGLMDSLDGELRQDAEEIHEAARRSADLTRQLLAFSRRQVLQTEVLDANHLLAGLESMLRPLIGESITLCFSLAPEPVHVRSDRGQLEQAVVNLVVNGRDAMPEGGKLTVETKRLWLPDPALPDLPPELAAGDYVLICIEDEGIGMDPEIAAHVMEPFYTTKPEGKGTGLGLPMAHGLARQCGGALVLDSRPGEGTRVGIFLPAVDGKRERTAATAPSKALPHAESRRCLLLAEDEERVRRLAARALRSAGYEVVEVADGAEALERARELGDALDGVVSDVVMPGLSGTALAETLRRERPELPVVLMSGYPEVPGGSPVPDDVVFLLKPFALGQLKEAVARVLDQKGEPARTRS